MTILVGAIDKKTNHAYLATDRMISMGSHTVNAPMIKIIDFDFMAIAGCGSVRGINVLETYLIPPMPMPDENVYHYTISRLVPAIQEAMKAANYNETSLAGGVYEMNNGLIVAVDGRLFQIGHDYSVMEFTDYVCDGSGMTYAYGALYVADKLKMKIEDKLALAIETAAAYDKNCGGGVSMVKKGKLNWVGVTHQAIEGVAKPAKKKPASKKPKQTKQKKPKVDNEKGDSNDTTETSHSSPSAGN